MKNLKSYILIGTGALLLALGVFLPNGDPVLGRIMNPQAVGVAPAVADLNMAGYDINGTGQIVMTSDDRTIANMPMIFRVTTDTDDEDAKGSYMEWQQYFASTTTYLYGSSTNAYRAWNASGFTGSAPTFTVSATGNKKIGWVGAHYDSPQSTGEPIHQHLNFETAKADMNTIITRLSISYGEDTALVDFPNSDVKIQPDYIFQLGSDTEGVKFEHNTALSNIQASTSLPFIFASTTGFRIGGTANPSALLDVGRYSDALGVKIKSNLGTANSTSLFLLESGAAGGTAIQSLVTGDTVNRFSMNTSGAMQWGSGSATRDLGISRGAAGKLYVGNGTSGSKAATLVVDAVGVGTTSPATSLDIYNSTATSTAYIYSGGAGLGGRLILEDVDAAGCTEITALDGVLSAAIVACP